jgi:hypothetical protein
MVIAGRGDNKNNLFRVIAKATINLEKGMIRT